MHKNMFGRQFKRDANERKALFKGLMTSLVLHDRIETTEEKAKSIRGSVEKLVTKAKKKGIQARPLLLPYLHEDAVQRLITDIAPRFSSRPGGYTRIIKLGRRFGDNASTVIMEWVEKPATTEAQKNKKIYKNKVALSASGDSSVSPVVAKKTATTEIQKKKETQKQSKAKKGEKKK